MLTLVIAEAALELVPPEIARHPSVVNDARRTGNEAPSILLDRSIHHAGMLSLQEHFKRGRPDLVYLSVLNATGTPLYQEGLARVCIHTRNDVVLELEERTRPPKSYSRFRDLMRKSLHERPSSGLIRVYEASIAELMKDIGADLVVALSIQGKSSSYEEAAVELISKRNPAALVGGFPRGHFTLDTTRVADKIVRVDRRSLEAHVVIARLLYEVEKLSPNLG